MEKRIMDRKKGNRVGRRIGGVFMALHFILFVSSPVYAADQITTGLNNLKSLVLSVVAVIGIIMVVKNVMEFSSAYQQQDSSGMNSALKGIVGGLMMAFVGAILGLLGVS